MPNYSDNLNLILPEDDENYDVDVANTNNSIIDNAVANKQNKVQGKGLSTNDFTDEYKQKVDIINTLTILENIYPVGSIYMSVNNTNPSTVFGGTWEQIKDVFLLSAGDTYTAGDTGGETEHKLISKELPSATAMLGGGDGSSMQYASTTNGSVSSGRPVVSSLSQFGNNYGYSHNNMPPYLVVYVWKRVS